MLRLKATLTSILESAKGAKSPSAEADLILFHVLRVVHPGLKNLSEIKISEEKIVPETEAEAIRLAYTRADGKPIQHVLGYQFFYEHEYSVNDSTLIPRPETEILVDSAIAWAENKFHGPVLRMAELGIGTGIISGEILSHFPTAHGYASEFNPEAIVLAERNMEQILGADFKKRITILQAPQALSGFEIFQASGPFDLVISNPPYVSEHDEIDNDVFEHEPHLALFPKVETAQEAPNYFYANFLEHAQSLLKPNGVAFFEVPHERAEEIFSMFQDSGFKQLFLIPDLTGRSRVLQAGF